MARAVARHLETEARDVVARGAHGHKLDAAATRGERQGPQRVRTAPVEQPVKAAHGDVHTVLVQFLDEALERLVVLELLVWDVLDCRSFQRHLNAPFLQA